MSILNKKINSDISTNSMGFVVLFFIISCFSWTIAPTIVGKTLADDISSEINYFAAGNQVNLEKQKIENKKSELYNNNIQISYPDSKTINISYSTEKLNDDSIRITERILDRLDSNLNSKIEKITLDGMTIALNNFELNRNIILNISKIEDLSKEHILTIKLK